MKSNELRLTEAENARIKEGLLHPNGALRNRHLFFHQTGTPAEIDLMVGHLAAQDAYMDGLDELDFAPPLEAFHIQSSQDHL